MSEIPSFVEEYNRIVADAPGPAELFGQFPGLHQYLAKAAGELVESHLIPCLAASPPEGCYDARIQRMSHILCRAFGGCVALGVELGYNERATEFIHRLLQEGPKGEEDGKEK
ncbi:MAG: hypothetical protein QMC81_00240 [Thermoanaerobacterales bacterium]|nr:hypothetical protein [Bacillota bacterium]MDI6905900.1 hypothetical protein [Thermoanaerobacterales bacterium]